MSNSLTDISTLERLFKGDRKGVEDWMQLYLEEAPVLFRELALRLEAGDIQGLAHIAHELRPQAHYLGAPRLKEALVTLGERVHSGNCAMCRDAVAELIALGQAIEDELRAWLREA